VNSIGTQRDRELVIVLSRRAAAQEADALLATRKTETEGGAVAVWTGGIVTLRELVDRGAAAHRHPRPILRGPAFQLFVAEILEEMGGRRRALFGPGSDSPGAARAIAAAVAEVRMAGLAASDLDHAAAEARGGMRRLEALAETLRSCEARLEKLGWWDAALLHREVTALVRKGIWPGELEQLEVRGLYDVTPLQAELLIELARRAARTRVVIPFEPHDEEATAFAFPYVKTWEAFDDPALDVEIAFPDEAGDGWACDIRFAATVDPADEARMAAEWICERAEEGAALEEIAIVLAGGVRGLGPIARELGRRGIVFHARRSAPLAETPLFAALLLPFRLFEEGFRRSDLQAWVTSSLTARLDPDRLRPALAQGPAGAGRLGEWNRALAAVRAETAVILTSVLRDLDGLARGDHPPSRFWSDYSAIVARVGLEPTAAHATVAAWTGWEQVLSDLREALEAAGRWDAPGVGWRIHRRHLAAVLGDRRAAEGRPGRGVSILTPQDARGLRFRHVAMLGLVQGSLASPRPAAAVLGDEERAALNEALGRRVFRLAAEDAREGSLLLRERLRATTGRLLLVHATTDDDGNPLLPALELETLRRSLNAEVAAPRQHDPTWRLVRTSEHVAALQRVERERAAFFAFPNASRHEHASRHDGAFAPRWVAELAREFEADGALELWSAGRLESWRQCPHQFLQRYVLRLEPPEERPLEAEPTVAGRVVHLALQELYREGRVELPDRDTIAKALAVAAANPDIGTTERGDPTVWDAVLRRALAVVARYFDYLRERHPPDGARTVACELAFGPPAVMPAVTVATAMGPIGLRGRIDRIDYDETARRLRVVDYKYSKAQRHRPAVDPERCGVSRFQLYVYLLAARAWLAERGYPDPREVVGFVHCLREPSVLKALPAPEREVVELTIAAAVEEVGRGVFDASPREPDDCRFCDFRRSCRIATVAGPLPAGAEEDER
jgi:RecB family exonuclease